MKILPFGKELSLLIKNGLKPNCQFIDIFIGKNSWLRGKQNSKLWPLATLVLPFCEWPENYFWPVAQSSVLIHDTGCCAPDYISEVIVNISNHSASSIMYFNYSDLKKITLYQ